LGPVSEIKTSKTGSNRFFLLPHVSRIWSVQLQLEESDVIRLLSPLSHFRSALGGWGGAVQR